MRHDARHHNLAKTIIALRHSVIGHHLVTSQRFDASNDSFDSLEVERVDLDHDQPVGTLAVDEFGDGSSVAEQAVKCPHLLDRDWDASLTTEGLVDQRQYLANMGDRADVGLRCDDVGHTLHLAQHQRIGHVPFDHQLNELRASELVPQERLGTIGRTSLGEKSRVFHPRLHPKGEHTARCEDRHQQHDDGHAPAT